MILDSGARLTVIVAQHLTPPWGWMTGEAGVGQPLQSDLLAPMGMDDVFGTAGGDGRIVS